MNDTTTCRWVSADCIVPLITERSPSEHWPTACGVGAGGGAGAAVTVTVAGAATVLDGALGAADGDDATGVDWWAEHPAIKPTARKGSIRFMFRSVSCGRASRGRSLNRLQNPPWRILGLANPFSRRAEPRL
jgi:hypothetical protein